MSLICILEDPETLPGKKLVSPLYYILIKKICFPKKEKVVFCY